MRTLNLSVALMMALLGFGLASGGYNNIFNNPALVTHNAVVISSGGAVSIGNTLYTSLVNSVSYQYNVQGTGIDGTHQVRLDILASNDNTNYSRPPVGATTSISQSGYGWFQYAGPFCYSQKPQFVNNSSSTVTVTCKGGMQ